VNHVPFRGIADERNPCGGEMNACCANVCAKNIADILQFSG